jgi:hypothetical protein
MSNSTRAAGGLLAFAWANQSATIGSVVAQNSPPTFKAAALFLSSPLFKMSFALVRSVPW